MRTASTALVAAALLLAARAAKAGCNVEEATDPVSGMTTHVVNAGKVADGLYFSAMVNTRPMSDWPTHALLLSINRSGYTDLMVSKGDMGVFVQKSGAKVEIPAAMDARAQRGVRADAYSAQAVSKWIVVFGIEPEQLKAFVADPIIHAQVGFGDQPMSLPFIEKKAIKAAKKFSCLLTE